MAFFFASTLPRHSCSSLAIRVTPRSCTRDPAESLQTPQRSKGEPHPSLSSSSSKTRLSFAKSNKALVPLRALLALSAAAAVTFFRRNQSGKRYWLRQFMAAAKIQEVIPKTKKIDSHLHVWASPEEAQQFPYFPGQEPTLPGSVSYLLQEGYKAIRFNPYLWPSGEKMTNEDGKAMFAKAGELGVVVGFMCFKGLLLHIEDIEGLCSEFPSTQVMIDHLGFCKPAISNDEAEAWKRLLGLAKFPQVYVKVSAFFRISREAFPYIDTWPLVQELLDTFGANRLLWGSDFPFITAECGYSKANQELPNLITQRLQLSESELEYLLGGTALQLFKGAWQESSPAA